MPKLINFHNYRSDFKAVFYLKIHINANIDFQLSISKWHAVNEHGSQL